MNLTKAMSELFITIREWAQPAFDALAERVDEREAQIRKDMDAAFEKLSKDFGDKIGLVMVADSLTKQEMIDIREYWESKFKDLNTGQTFNAPDFQPLIDSTVASAFEKLERPKNGKDALEIDIQPRIDESKSYDRGTYATHNGGLWRAHANTYGMRGWECIVDGVNACEVEQVDERNVVNIVKMASGKQYRVPITLPTMLYRNVWREGQYQKGDVVTWGGCIWHCDQDTDTKPSESAEHWTLAVKKGRDGKSA